MHTYGGSVVQDGSRWGRGAAMQVRGLRRRFGTAWYVLSRLVPVVVAVEVAMLFLWSAHADAAATQVAYVHAEHRGSYAAERVYAGRTVAGRVAALGFKHAGELDAVAVDIGGRVEAGAVLARLDAAAANAALAQAEADVRHAAASLEAMRARTELSRQTERRYADLQADGHVSAQEYDERRLEHAARRAELDVAAAALARARAARDAAAIVVDEARIIAPFAGVVQARYADEGAQLQPGERVLRLVESGRVEAHVGVPETVAADLDTGARYSLRWGERMLPASLGAVLPEVDPETRTVTAVFQLGAVEVPLGAVVELVTERAVDVAGFWLPLTALTESDRGLWGVLVINEQSLLERRIVEVLHAEGDRAFVRGTLSNGDRVVSSGVQRLVPGQQVAPAAAG